MNHRDNNETGQPNTSQPSPGVTLDESASPPLITEDYGTLAELRYVARLLRNGSHKVIATRKVDTDSRYVVEFQVVKRGEAQQTAPLDSSVELPCGSLVPKGWPR